MWGAQFYVKCLQEFAYNTHACFKSVVVGRMKFGPIEALPSSTQQINSSVPMVGNLTCGADKCSLILAHEVKSIISLQVRHCYFLQSNDICSNWSANPFKNSLSSRNCKHGGNNPSNTVMASIVSTLLFLMAIMFFVLYLWQRKKR